MLAHFQLGEIRIDVVRKDIKNVHLSVLPPTGDVRIAAPRRMKLDAIRLFAISKLPWIKQHQKKMRAQEREPQQEYIDRESHYVWGKRYLLKLVPHDAAPAIKVKHKVLQLHARPEMSAEKREAALDGWYREQIRAALLPLLEKWQPLLSVQVNRVFVRRMKTKWGSANPSKRNIRLNTELAKKPPECFEYVVLHELSHFLSPRHDQRFIALLDEHLPQWRTIREILNMSPLRHEEWR
jgi:predicted metal-dependent hydrolase